MATARYSVRMDDEEPEEFELTYHFAPDPLKIIDMWCARHGYRPHDCITDGVINRQAFSWNYQPKTGGFFSSRENHICTARMIPSGDKAKKQ